ncbi:MAG: hypothetical protein PWQ75_936 [Methanolobus sp.]|jgi:uncharacterized protein YcfL|uniref:peptidase domain-containing protein n=1 Tax=Methanolobus sp. TaxID=1874737 RepID=UPI00258837FA|nr:peptidase domain-containing protein [Methanolobus sp.]MDK2831184.1 hypothetical protein [Methanolobus sp.]
MKRIAIAFLVFLLCVSVASASSSEKTADSSDLIVGIKSISSTITQGEVNWHSTYISSSNSNMIVDLNWGDTTDSLKLYVYDPSGNSYGPYYDSADGSINGRINLLLDKNPEVGTWRCKVYGYYVVGTEDYSI